MRRSRKNAFFAACALGLTLAGCGERASGGASAGAEDPSVATLPPLPTLPPGLTVRLTPHPDRGALDVEIHLVGPFADHTKELTIARAWAGVDGFSALRGVSVRDEIGEIGTRQTAGEGPDRVLALDRAPERGHLLVRYRATSATEDAPRFAMHLDRERLSGVGHTFLLLPRIDAALPTRIELRPGALAPGASGASSFGVGDDVETTATPDDLAHAVYLAGRTRVLEGAATNASDRVVLLGRPTFDAELVQAKLARAKAGMAKVFPGTMTAGDANTEGFSALVIAEPGLGKGHDGALLGRSLGLWVGEERPFDASLVIAATHELGHRVIGQTVRLVSEGGEPQVWFSEGFTVHYARKIALAEGLVGPAEFAEDLERTLSRTAPALPGHARSREAYQRGALYAAMLDAALQKASRGARSLDDLMREITARAVAEKKVDLPASALRELVTRELGPARGEELDWVMVKGHGEITLADDAFGPCFERAKRKHKVFDLGFDPASLRESPAMIRGLVARSAAARAGLEEGMLVISSKVPTSAEGDRDRPVEIVIAGRRGSRKIRYLPAGEREEIRWARKGSCKKR